MLSSRWYRYYKCETKGLNIYYNQITSNDIPDVCKFLNQHSEITSLDIRYNNLGAEDAKALAQNKTLTSLNMRGNHIGIEGAKALAQNTTLTSLNVRNNYILDEGAKALAQNTTLTYLNVLANYITDKGEQALLAVTEPIQRCNNDIKTASSNVKASVPSLTSQCLWFVKKEKNNPRLQKAELPLELIDAINKPQMKIKF